MPFVQQYVMGMDRTFQREIGTDSAAELHRAGLDVGDSPFPGVAMWDDNVAIEFARDILRRLAPNVIATCAVLSD